MRRRTGILVYVSTLVAVVVSLDVLFFRHRFAERLVVNVLVVALFSAGYLKLSKRDDRAVGQR